MFEWSAADNILEHKVDTIGRRLEVSSSNRTAARFPVHAWTGSTNVTVIEGS